MILKQRIAIFALNQGYNKDRQILMANNMSYKYLRGVYKEETEASYLVALNSDSDLDKVLDLARQYNQESILIREPDGSAYLIFCADGSTIELGIFKSVPKMVAISQDGYSFDPSTETYYSCL